MRSGRLTGQINVFWRPYRLDRGVTLVYIVGVTLIRNGGGRVIAKDKKRVYVTMDSEDMEMLDHVIEQGLASNYSQAAGVLIKYGCEAFNKLHRADERPADKE